MLALALTLLVAQADPTAFVDLFMRSCALTVPEVQRVEQLAQQQQWQPIPAEQLGQIAPHLQGRYQGWQTSDHLVTTSVVTRSGITMTSCSVVGRVDHATLSQLVRKEMGVMPAERRTPTQQVLAWVVRMEGQKMIISLSKDVSDPHVTSLSAVVVDHSAK